MGMPMFGERPLKELSDDQLLDWITYYIGFSEWVKDSGSFDTGVSPTMYHINEELELRDLTRPDPRLFDPAKDRDPGALSTGRTTQFNVPHVVAQRLSVARKSGPYTPRHAGKTSGQDAAPRPA